MSDDTASMDTDQSIVGQHYLKVDGFQVDDRLENNIVYVDSTQ